MTRGEPSHDLDAAGIPPRKANPTREEIRDAQECHPFCRLLLKGLGASLHDRPFAMEPILPCEGDPEYSAFWREIQHFAVEADGVLVRKSKRLQVLSNGNIIEFGPRDVTRIVVPPKFQAWAMACHHDRRGHLGVVKTFPGFLRAFYWGTREAMRRDYSDYVADCVACIHCKVARHKSGAGVVVQNGEHPFDITSADYYKVGRDSRKGARNEVFIGPGALADTGEGGAQTTNDLPEEGAVFDGTVSFGCQFSRTIKSVATKGTPTARCIARLLIAEVIRHYGTPRAVRSDHGSNFVAQVLKALYKHFGIRMEASAPYHHRTVGLVERWHSVLKQLIMTHRHASGEDEWHIFLPFMELAFNTALNAATGFSPMFITTLRHVRLPMDSLSAPLKLSAEELKLPDWVREYLQVRGIVYDEVSKSLQLNQLHRLRKFNLQRDVITEHPEGSSVLITKGRFVDGNLPKAEEPTEGPFVVERKLENGNYSLVLGARRLKNFFHADRLIACPGRRTIVQSELGDWYPVKGVVARRVSKDGSRLEYRIQWAGFDKSQYQTWLSMEHLYGIAHLVAEYNASHPLPPAFATEPQPLHSRESIATPPTNDAARAVPHFKRVRAPATAVSPSPPDGKLSELPVEAEVPGCEDCSEDDAPALSMAPPLIPLEQLEDGVEVEVFLPNASQQLGKKWASTSPDVWLPARVRRTRVLPARALHPERQVVVVIFDGDSSRKERTFELGCDSTNPIRFPSSSNAAAASSDPTTWIQCAHGAVLVSGGNKDTPFPGYSKERCHALNCRDGCGVWFEKFSTTSTWRSVYDEGRKPSLIHLRK